MKVQTKIHFETKYSFVEIPKPRGCRNPASEKCSTPLRSLIERVMTAQVFVPVIWELHTQLEETGLVQTGFKCCWPNLTRTQQTPEHNWRSFTQTLWNSSGLRKIQLKEWLLQTVAFRCHTHTQSPFSWTPLCCALCLPLLGGFVQPKNTQGCTSQFSRNAPHLMILPMIRHNSWVFPKELINRTKKVLRSSISFIPQLQQAAFTDSMNK